MRRLLLLAALLAGCASAAPVPAPTLPATLAPVATAAPTVATTAVPIAQATPAATPTTAAALPTPVPPTLAPTAVATAPPTVAPTAAPTPTVAPTAPPTPEPTEEPCPPSDDVDVGLQVLEVLLLEEQIDHKYKDFTAAKAGAKKPSYKDFFRNAEKYDAETVYFRGEVIQTLYDEAFGGEPCEGKSPLLDGTATVMRVNVTKGSFGLYEDTVYVTYLGSKRVLEDDIISIVGYGTGIISYESTTGATISIPSILVGKFLGIAGT